MKATIYCGIPGAGKSTIVANRHPDEIVCSTDNFFVRFGEYKFDPMRISEAHAWCIRNFLHTVQLGIDNVVVDNTNTSIAELAPYVAIAQAFGYDVEVVTVLCDVEKAHARNVHGVPLDVVKAMSKRLEKRDIPPWWVHRTVDQREDMPASTQGAA